MKLIVNNIIPFKGYDAMTIWPFIFVKGEIKKHVYNHECIHGEQQKELFIILFYIIYGLEYIIKLAITRNHKTAYRSISFETEAYKNECSFDYIKTRKHYNWIKYVFKLWRY